MFWYLYFFHSFIPGPGSILNKEYLRIAFPIERWHRIKGKRGYKKYRDMEQDDISYVAT